MIYPYSCNSCKHDFEVIKSVRHIDDDESCELCGHTAVRTIAKSQAFYGANDWDTAHYSTVLGMKVRSNKEAQKIARERGLVEVGTENIEKIHKKFDTEREKKIETRYDDILNTTINVRTA
jgi:putative FmdB family regulatory protein